MISTVSLLNELFSMPMTPRCHVLCFTNLYFSTTESPARFSFFFNNPLNCLWFIYPTFERFLFPAESSLTLDLWNKAIFLSIYLILRPLTLHSPTTVRSAEHFLTKLKNTTIQPDEITVSFDVTSLFTSIPKGLAETAVRESLSQHRDDSNANLKNEHLLEVLKLCMQTFFTFQNLPYEQIKGTPMGSPISGYIADINMTITTQSPCSTFPSDSHYYLSANGITCPHQVPSMRLANKLGITHDVKQH